MLSKVQEALQIFPEQHVLLEGQTDSRGNASTNKRLSEQRASAVRDRLIELGSNPGSLEARGAGESNLMDSGSTEASHQLNRRVEFEVMN